MFRKLTHSLFAAGLLLASHGPAQADDSEIYVSPYDTSQGKPLVMFTLDWRPNLASQVCNDWSACEPLFTAAGIWPEDTANVTFFELLRAAIKVVLAPVTDVYIGLMLNHDSRNNCEGKEIQGCSNGGYVAMGFQALTVDTTDEGAPAGVYDPVKEAFDGVLKSIPMPRGQESHFYQGRELFYELERYLTDGNVYNGYVGFTSFDSLSSTPKGDPKQNIWQEEVHASRWKAVMEELAAAGKQDAADIVEDVMGFAQDPTVTNNPEAPFGRIYQGAGSVIGDCSQIYTINLLFQVSQQENNSDTEIAAKIPRLRPKGSFEDIIEYLNRQDLADDKAGDQKVVSYFFGDPRFTSGDSRKLDSYAQAGGTGYARELSDDPEQLVADLQNIFDQILSVSTTFTAAALPINSFDRAQLREDVFLALFQPQNRQFPQDNRYWWGNVKKLQLPGLNSAAASIELVDANGDPAIDADGRIRRDRLTFWTNPGAPDVQDPSRDPDELAKAGFDGRSVNRGGGGHRIPTFPQATPAVDPGPRTIYYDTVGGVLDELDTSGSTLNAIKAELEVDTYADPDAVATELVHYLSGRDPSDPNVPTDWMMGAAMHSRPLPINYGAADNHTADNPLVYVAVGTNDGLFRFIRNTEVGDAKGNPKNVNIHVGKEAWAFAPRATMRHARRIFLGDGDTPAALDETTVYGVDGPPVAWLDDKNGDGTIDADAGDRAYVFFGLRRGGRAYYGLDVSYPESPRLMWKIDADEDAEFADMGLTFSEPSVGFVDSNNDGAGELVLIFGGGYDRVYDDKASPVIPDPGPLKGNSIYVVNAVTGALVANIGRYDDPISMADSIVSGITAVDTNGDDLLDRLYAGDLGGRVWRVDMPRGAGPSDWPVNLLASLGRRKADAVVNGPDDRRFFHKPDVVQAGAFKDANGTVLTGAFDAVMITSGNRASPMDLQTINYAFMIRDSDIGILNAESTDTNVITRVEDLLDVTGSLAARVDDTYDGWKLRLAAIGEKGLATPLTISNVVFFTTYVPPGATAGDQLTCGPKEGSGRLYRVSLFNGNPLRDQPLDPWDTTPAPQYVDLRSGGIPAEVVALPPNRILRPDLDVEPVPITARWRTFWHLEEDPVN